MTCGALLRKQIIKERLIGTTHASAKKFNNVTLPTMSNGGTFN